MISVRDLIFEDTEPSEEDRAIHIISFSDEATDDDILIAKMRYKHVITYGINKNCDIIKGDPDVPYMKVGKPLTQEMIDRLNLLREQLDDKRSDAKAFGLEEELSEMEDNNLLEIPKEFISKMNQAELERRAKESNDDDLLEIPSIVAGRKLSKQSPESWRFNDRPYQPCGWTSEKQTEGFNPRGESVNYVWVDDKAFKQPESTITVSGFNGEKYYMGLNEESEEETVNHPNHYGGDTVYEAIKVIEAWELGFCLGNTVKYISRAGKKDKTKEIEDIRKALWYLQRHLDNLEKV